MKEEKHPHDPMDRPKPAPRAGHVGSAMSILTEHTVQKGETLSHIALHYYGSAIKDKWMIIYEANKTIIGENPNHLPRGITLRIPKLPD